MNSKLYPLGLALGGGGARGFAHLGVAQALAEAGLRPDIISGTSAGSIVGAMLASGHTPLECMELFAHMKMRHLAKPAVSRKGFLEYSHLEEELGTFIGVKTFEELKIPLVVTASDMNTAQPVHFRTGELLPCIIASCSIPVVFVPREINGKEYVDGGVFMNVPVRPIRPACRHVIAVDINSFDTTERIPNMLRMAIRAFHICLARNTDIDHSMADRVIEPENLTRFGIFDIEHYQDIFNAGYQAAKHMLEVEPLN